MSERHSAPGRAVPMLFLRNENGGGVLICTGWKRGCELTGAQREQVLEIRLRILAAADLPTPRWAACWIDAERITPIYRPDPAWLARWSTDHLAVRIATAA